jgi:hypothetical protein
MNFNNYLSVSRMYPGPLNGWKALFAAIPLHFGAKTILLKYTSYFIINWGFLECADLREALEQEFEDSYCQTRASS